MPARGERSSHRARNGPTASAIDRARHGPAPVPGRHGPALKDIAGSRQVGVRWRPSEPAWPPPRLTLVPSLARAADLPVTITVDAAHPTGPLRPAWRSFGYDEANFTYAPDGQKLVGELGRLGTADAPVFVRCHDLPTSGDGVPGLKWSSTNAYTEDAAGRPAPRRNRPGGAGDNRGGRSSQAAGPAPPATPDDGRPPLGRCRPSPRWVALGPVS